MSWLTCLVIVVKLSRNWTITGSTASLDNLTCLLCLQAGNNLLIVQSPGQPAVVQQVQLVQSKPESQMVQIPQQALKVVQAASATLPPVPQRQSMPSSLQVAQTDSTPTQVSVQTHSHLRTTLGFLTHSELFLNVCNYWLKSKLVQLFYSYWVKYISRTFGRQRKISSTKTMRVENRNIDLHPFECV